MRSRRNQFHEFCRSLGSLVAGGLVVAAIVGVFLYCASYRIEDGPADRAMGRPGLKGEKTGIGRRGDLARNDAGPARPRRKTSKGSPRNRVEAVGEEVVEVVEEEDDETSSMARPTSPGKEPAGPSSAASPPHGPPSVALAEYESRKAHTPDTAVAQARLARWCDEHDLKDEARAHWEAVTRLNPKGEAAWKRLGYKKHHNRWMTDAMIADEAEQAHADRRWKKVLDDLHKRLHAKGPDAPAKRDAVEAELARVDDPRAAPMLWQVFAGDAGHHLLLAGLLRRLESPRSSRMLAALAVYSRDAKARHAAFEALRGRDPSEFAEPLIALLGPPLKYRITAVPGQGRTSAKALEVEDERVNRQFIYVVPKGGASGADDPFGGCSNTLGTRGVGWTAQGRQLARALNAAESRKAEAAAEMQLQSDIAAVESINTSIREMNDRVVALLTATSRVDHGADREAWRRWLAERQDRPYSPPEEAPKLTIAQLVPPIYRPTFIDVPAPS